MIDSRYWKEELVRIAKTIKPTKKRRRWSERSHCIVERDLMIGFFIVRRLLELHKVSSLTRKHKMTVYSSPRKAKIIHRQNAADIDESYDLEKQRRLTKTPSYISNQFIHAYLSWVAMDESGNWSDVFIVSDFDRNNCIWRIPLETIRELFMFASKDYPHTIRMTFDQKKQDYEVETN